MAQINCGTLYGYQNNNTAYGAFTVYFSYDGTTRNGTTVTITNPRVKCAEYGADGYTIESSSKKDVGTSITLKIKEDTEDEEYYYYNLGVYEISEYREFEFRLIATGDGIYDDDIIYSFMTEVGFC